MMFPLSPLNQLTKRINDKCAVGIEQIKKVFESFDDEEIVEILAKNGSYKPSHYFVTLAEIHKDWVYVL